MTISAISGSNPASATVTPSQQQQQAKPAPQAPKAETVSLSQQALQLASDGDTQDQEIKENAAEKAGETLKGKK